MNPTSFLASRRAVLTGALVGALAWASRPLLPRVRAQEKPAAITAALVNLAPTEPDDPLWSGRSATSISLNPQNLVVPRVQEAGAKSIDIRALYDAERLSILIAWKDAGRNVNLGTVMQYRDGVAVQFPRNPSAGPTSFMMGVPGLGVSIYHWKSDWQFARLYDVDEAYPNMFACWYPYSGVPAGGMAEATDYLTAGRKEYLTAAAAGNALSDPIVQESIGPVQKMRAEGFGTLEPSETQDGKGMGTWKDGEWRIVISIPRKQEQFTFAEGSLVPLSFAVWDGSRSERNGQKAFSDWQETRLGPAPAVAEPTVAAPTKAPGSVAPTREAPVPQPAAKEDEDVGLLVPLFSGIGGAVLVGVAAIIGLRMRRSRRERDQQT
jgi:hypothetical protein